MAKITLKGIAWDHSRGLVPLQAAAQRFHELHPNVEVIWEKRSLQSFADYPIEKLTGEYDLLIIDHPWIGCAAETGCVVALDEYIAPDLLAELSQHSVGCSHQSYEYNNKQWALAIDAATPVASFRSDLIKDIPTTWEQVLGLAKEGRVVAPAIPIDLLMNFYTFCIALGQQPFLDEEVVHKAIAFEALETMKLFYSLLDPCCFTMNPIEVAAVMTQTDDYIYCPFAYGYSNYSRKNYALWQLTYTGVVQFGEQLLQPTLGGTGIAVSSYSTNKPVAVDFVNLVCSPGWQASEYILTGGQPGYDYGYQEENNNRLTNNFFVSTLPTLEQSYMRPRYNGYLGFQDIAGVFIQQYLKGEVSSKQAVINNLNILYQKSLKKNKVSPYD